MSRVRNTTEAPVQLDITYQGYRCNGTKFGSLLHYPYDNVENSAEIVDEVGSRGIRCGSVRRAKMNPCVHWREQFSGPSGSFRLNLIDCTGYNPLQNGYAEVSDRRLLLRWHGLLPSPNGSLREIAEGYTGTDPASFYERWQECKPTLGTRANLTVFLVELRDIRKMFDLLPNKHFSLRNWREVLKYVNSQHLNWNFGWRPFLSDIYKTWNGLTSFEKRVKHFLRNANRDLHRKAKDGPIEGEEIGEWRPGDFNTAASVRQIVRWKREYASTFDFSYAVPNYSFNDLRWRAYLDTLGLKANLANVWALLPWSFVVDWFANLQPWMDSFGDDWVQPWIYFCQGCNSTKSEIQIRLETRFRVYSSQPWQTFDPFIYTLTHYTRSTGFPSPEIIRHELDADKIRLLASLVASLLH